MLHKNSIEDAAEQLQFEGLIQDLMDNQFGCIENFVDAATILGLRNNLNKLSLLSEMKVSGIGNKTAFNKNDLVRNDCIKWLEKDSTDVHEMVFSKKVDSFIKYLNKTCFTSLLGFDSHYASYAQSSFYKRHLDQFKNDKGRKFSIILYLNEDWQVADGGLLSLYPKDKPQNDIAPMGGRLVFFRSDEMEHEVHPSFTKERLSIAGWFCG